MQIKDLEVFNNMPFLRWVKDQDGRYLWVNRAVAQFAGEDIVGKTDHEITWAYDADALRAVDKQVFETGKTRYLHEVVGTPSYGKVTASVCKFVQELDGKKRTFGIAFVIE